MASADLYDAYRAWCGEHGIEPVSWTAFGRRLSEEGLSRAKSGNVYYVGLHVVA